MAKTYGTIQYCEGQPRGTWVIDCEPQVRTRLRRLFARVDGYGDLRLADTLETCRDLDWFLERYPMTGDTERLRSRAVQHKARVERMAEIVADGYVPMAIELAVPMRDYQRVAAEAALCTGGLLLADEVGLGKTCSAIGMIADPRVRPALVVTLTHLPLQWQRELARFAPGLRTHILKSGQPYDIVKAMNGRRRKAATQTSLPGIQADPFPDVIITSYSKLAGWADELSGKMKGVVFDECVTGDTVVSGWAASPDKRIADLRPGDLVAAFDEKWRVCQDRVVAVVHKGRRRVWRLVLSDGRHLDCTDNERLLTPHGWIYAREVIDASGVAHTGDATCTAQRYRVAANPWLSSGRRVHRHKTDSPSPAIPTRSGATYVLARKGAHSECVRENATDREHKQGIWADNVPIRDGHHASVRLLARTMPRGRAKGYHSGVAGPNDVGGGCVLVYGRRPCGINGHDGRDQYSFVCPPGSDVARRMAVGEWHTTGGGRGDHGRREEMLDITVSPSSGDSPRRGDSPVCVAVHGVQDTRCACQNCDVLILRGRDGTQEATAVQHSDLWSAAVSAGGESTLQGLADASELVEVDIDRVLYLGPQEVWDIETARHHTFFANGVAVHNCQELRHHTSQRYAAAKAIAHAADYRISLSATPIFNYGSEIWSVLDATCPDSLGTRDEFIREWCGASMGMGDKPAIRNPKAFGMYAREHGLMLRRTREDVGRELPDLTKVPYTIDADTAALDKVGASAAELARIILAQGETHKGAKMQAAEEFSNLMRQYTGIAKAPYVAEFVKLLVESGEKVLLFGWHRSVYDIWLDALKDLKPALYTGSESPAQKAEAARRFIESETPVLIMSLRAGAGLDGLQGHCRIVVFGELDWSPKVHDQAIGRVHRDGQDEKVVAYFLVSDHGADPVMADVLALKKSQSDGIVDPTGELVELFDTGGGHVRRLAETYLATKEAA